MAGRIKVMTAWDLGKLNWGVIHQAMSGGRVYGGVGLGSGLRNNLNAQPVQVYVGTGTKRG